MPVKLPRWMFVLGLMGMLVAYATQVDAARPKQSQQDDEQTEKEDVEVQSTEARRGQQEELRGSLRGRRWYLGIQYRPLHRGVEVHYVDPHSPADDAGLEQGDVIRAIDHFVIDRYNPFRRVLQQAGNASGNGDVVLDVIDVNSGNPVSVPAHLIRVR